MLTALVTPGMVRVGALLDLSSAETHHLQVRRAASGERIRLMDGSGGAGWGVLSIARKEARVEVMEAEQRPRPAPLRLAVGAGDRDRFGWLVEKAGELGVTDLIPLETERTAHVASRIRPTHIAKLQLRALESIKQSGAHWAPAVHEPVNISAVLTDDAGQLRLVGEAGSDPMPGILPAAGVTCLIGPEGGWTPGELAGMGEARCTFVRLSSNILRFETAAVAMAVLVQDRRRGS